MQREQCSPLYRVDQENCLIRFWHSLIELRLQHTFTFSIRFTYLIIIYQIMSCFSIIDSSYL